MSYPHHSYPHHHHLASRAAIMCSSTSCTRLEADLVPSPHVIVLSRPGLLLASLVSLVLVASLATAATPSRKHVYDEYRLMMRDRALLNLNLMNTIGSCRDPRPLVVYPQGSANKIFHPKGTLVHRCNDQTGCCLNPGEVCRPDTMQEFQKVFFVNIYVVGQKFGKATPRFRAPKANYTTTYETVTFTNHTSCRCVKLPPNSIEHDDTQSVVSRPLTHQMIEPYSSNSLMYYIVVSIGIIIGIVILVVVLKWAYINPSRPART